MQVKAALFPLKEPPDPFCRGLCGPHSRCGHCVVEGSIFFLYVNLSGCPSHSLGAVLTDILGLPSPLPIVLKFKA